MSQCTEHVLAGAWLDSYPCSRKAVKDGKCTQHHPDTIKNQEAKRAAQRAKQRDERQAMEVRRGLEQATVTQLRAELKRRRAKS